MRKIIIIATILVMNSTLLYSGDDYAVLKKFAKELLKLRSYSVDLSQTIIYSGGKREHFSGHMIMSRSGDMHIRYDEPVIQKVIRNKSGLFWYYPGSGKLYIIRKKSLVNGGYAGDRGISYFNKVLSDNMELSFMGERYYGFFKKAALYSIKNKKGKEKGRTAVIWIDLKSGLPVKKYFLERSGKEVLSESYGEYTKVDGVPLPGLVVIHMRGSGGVLKTITRYKNFKVNINIPKTKFIFKASRGMDVHEIK